MIEEQLEFEFYDIYDTTEIRRIDSKMEIFLHDLARREDNEFIQRIANRFTTLSTKAHSRKHWTGSE
jgi:hypothetical protein